MHSGFFKITLFVTREHYNYTSAQTDIFVTDWPRVRPHHGPECVGVGYRLPVFTVTITESLWMRASPKRLARSSK